MTRGVTAGTKQQRERAFRRALRDQLSGGRCASCSDRTEHLQFSHYSRADKYRTAMGRPRDFSRLSIPQMKIEASKGCWECLLCAAVNTRAENEALPPVNTKRAILRRRVKQRCIDFVNGVKMDTARCRDCAREVTKATLCAFDFDHLDATTKVAKISSLVSAVAPIETIRAEIAKCELVCKVCHAERTYTRRTLSR